MQIERLGSILTLPPSEAEPPAPGAEPSTPEFSRVLRDLGTDIDRGERVMNVVLNGHWGSDLNTTQLLALQAGVYRYSEAVELGAKLVDRFGSCVRTTLQGSG